MSKKWRKFPFGKNHQKFLNILLLSRKLKGITEVEKEESYSLEFIYYFERKDYFKVKKI